MSNGFLSQEEIDSLLNGNSTSTEPQTQEVNEEAIITDLDKDLLGEIGNISMGSASTALSQIINQSVNITTPVVSVTTLKELKRDFHVPNIVLEIEYTSGISGQNILVMQVKDAAVIANLMMGGDGTAVNQELSEIEISAVQEAMNQMMGSAATSMATMLAREVNISPPLSKTWEDANDDPLAQDISEDDQIVKVSFTMTIGSLVDSNIMQILPVKTAKTIVSIMMGEEPKEEVTPKETVKEPVKAKPVEAPRAPEPSYERPVAKEPARPPVEVHEVAFESLNSSNGTPAHRNIDLILDVPLEISVVLGRCKKNIKDILNLSNGSLIELEKLADEPVEILVNGKRVALGEVVVVDENFGVRISSIISGAERIKSLR
ncbi:flagellar motor switch protein FliN/FliY [Clostridium cavendishii DSM 21758]|uniref:Flagellar motor switch protein FliN/FliY n=1 Tax=Clostridium cavendishii DSM 21758 TaxID=1121302 RepID=A0A1M6B597_9CLOT|nr:flagellar motor switch phosphatase FliY [Clostridium cavendishii]SHI43643.1 flagellar motor switch protein FliN/FliY [Clostridium cavendishii DSM 21758]